MIMDARCNDGVIRWIFLLGLVLMFSLLWGCSAADRCSAADKRPSASRQAASAPNAEKSPILFSDGFESGDMKTTNADGFKWANNNKTMVVTAEKVVWRNRPKDDAIPEGRDWKPKNGKHCLLFRFPPLDAGKEPWAEQKFILGKAYPEIWFRYWLRVPTNFKHGPKKVSNNKFFALWMDGYSVKGEGQTVVWNYWRQADDNSKFTFSATRRGHVAGSSDFLVSPRDRGRWMQIVLYAKRNSSPDAKDGVARIYRRWDGEKKYTLISEIADYDLYTPKDPKKAQGWTRGYILGWANAGFEEETEWLLDDFTISEHSLLDAPVEPRAKDKKTQ